MINPHSFITTNFVAEKATRNVDFFTTDNDDFLARENLLRDDGRQSAKEVALAIDDDGGRRESGHGGCLCEWSAEAKRVRWRSHTP